ncbi:hypothetical protein [Novipirellula artificiosorum]|uniref:DUF1579 domain-containing protein n=1 Tax=Novipirellula artificiosorum TaxID=2528016 RepID=A0A5C6DFU8_9BACT|nr:hypothetical protein [Novipirellula artificiosorum]TWU34844.1 hypothetical protein Poly41_39870 [Novipirellula artificiosorum]
MRFLHLHLFLALIVFAQVTHAIGISPETAQKEMESLVGEWEGTLEYGGASSSAKWNAEWAPGKQCLIIHEEYDNIEGGTNKVTALVGYDRLNRQIVNLGFRTDGGNRTMTFTDSVFKAKMTGDDLEGKASSCDVVVKRNEGEMTFVFKGVSPDGEDMLIQVQRKK